MLEKRAKNESERSELRAQSSAFSIQHSAAINRTESRLPDRLVESTEEEYVFAIRHHSVAGPRRRSAGGVDLLPPFLLHVETPQISVVVELRLGRTGELAAENPHLTTALRDDDGLMRASRRRRQRGAQLQPSVLFDVVSEEVVVHERLAAIAVAASEEVQEIFVGTRDERRPASRRRRVNEVLGDALLAAIAFHEACDQCLDALLEGTTSNTT